VEQLPFVEGATPGFGLVGDSPKIQRVLQKIRKLKGNRSPVLLLGESGTGKELVARALHAVSPGPSNTFVALNCAALPSTLADSELFGHARGSFTGALTARQGLIALAHGGTLFLDEIGDLPLEVQAKLLRALETCEIRPIGARDIHTIDFRLIAATNHDLAKEAGNGAFRLDLLCRLNVISFRLPPLRERMEDIPLLARHLIGKYAPRPMAISAEALEALRCYDWPGNVRQLANCLQQAIAFASGAIIDTGDLPSQVRNTRQREGAAHAVVDSCAVLPLSELERLAIEHAMKIAGGDRRRAAQALGIGRTTLYRKLKQYSQHKGRPATA
jgi:DNA-binding NtrC family response regulator